MISTCYDSQAWWYKLHVLILYLAPPSLQLKGNVKISKALVLPHVKRLKNETVRMLLVTVSLVCQLRESVSII